MKIRFSWYLSEAFNDGVLRPLVSVLDGVDGFKNTIVFLLMDDGGRGHEGTINEINDVLNKIRSIKHDLSLEYAWDRDCWGANISLKGVEIYSQVDCDYFDCISLSSFEMILVEWLNFIVSMPDLDSISEFYF